MEFVHSLRDPRQPGQELVARAARIGTLKWSCDYVQGLFWNARRHPHHTLRGVFSNRPLEHVLFPFQYFMLTAPGFEQTIQNSSTFDPVGKLNDEGSGVWFKPVRGLE